MDKFSQLRAAGFNDTEINDYLGQQSSKLLSAGFSQDEVAKYLGAPPPPNDDAIRRTFRTNLDKATAPGEDGQRKPLNFTQAIEAGFGMSVSGLAYTGKVPEQKPSGDESWYNRIAYSAAQMLGDVPAMLAGAAVGGTAGAPTGIGAAATAMGGAFAMPAALRATMIDSYTKGEFKDWRDFFERASGILIDTAKNYVTGAATGVAGKVAGPALGAAGKATGVPVSASAKTVASVSAEIGTMVTVGKALEKEIPSLQDFVDAGVLLLGAKGAIKAAGTGKTALMDVYKKTGIKPEQVLSDVRGDPTILQDIAAGKFPEAYKDQIDPEFKMPPEPTTPGETFKMPEGEVPAGETFKLPQGEALTVTDNMAAGGTAPPPPRTTAPPPTTPQQVMTQRQALETMAQNLGIEVRLTPGPDFHSSSTGYINVPPEGYVKSTERFGITDSEFIFAHELGHAILVTRRGVVFGRQRQDGNFSYWSNAKLKREISNWDEFTEASKEMRPEMWNDPALGQQKYVRTPDELVADTIAAVLTGRRDISILYPLMDMVGMKPEGLGIASGGGGTRGPGGFPTPAAGTPEPGSLREAQQTILGKVDIGGENPKQPITLEGIYSRYLDDLAPIKSIVESMTEGREIPAANNPYVLARLTRGIFGKVQQALEFGTFDFGTLKNNGKSLKDILEPVKDDLDGLRAYAISSRALELKKRFLVSGFDIDAANKVVAESAAKFEPVMRELVEFQNRITAYLRDAGVLTPKAYAEMLKMNQNYVPFYRILEGEAGSRGAGTGLQTRNPIKQFKGSGMDIVDPLESIIKNTYTYLTLADRNAVGVEFYRLGRAVSGGENDNVFFSKKPPNLRATTVTDKEMAAFLKSHGITDMPSEALTVFRAVREPLADNEIGFFNGGKWTVLEVDPDVAAAFKATDRQTTGLLMKFLAAPAKLLRVGSTLDPDFMARNFVRDQFSAFINSKVGFVPVVDTMLGAMHMLRKDEVFQNWLKSGGANATLMALDRKYIQSEIFKLTDQLPETNFLGKAWNVAKTPVDWLRVTSELIENATRLGEFNRAGGSGKSGMLEAGLGSREVTLDFARVGANAKAMNMITAFFNSQVQGVDRTIRTIKEHPVGAMAKIGAAITLPSVLLWMANHDDPRWKELRSWERDLFWIVMTKDNIYRIPKPFELGVIFGSSVERMLDAVENQFDKHDMKEFLKTMGGGFVPNLVPTFASPVLEQLTNYSFFNGRQLVPGYLQDPKTGVLPEYRYTEYTSELTKAMGHVMGVVPGVKSTSMASPIVIDNYIRSWTGGLGSKVMQMADAGLRKAGVLPDPVLPEKTLADIPVIKAFVVRFPTASAESIQKFRDDFQTRKQAYNTIVSLAKQGDFDASERVMQVNPQSMIRLEQMDQTLTQMNHTIRLIYKNPDIPPDEKRQVIDATYYNMIQITRMGNLLMKQIDQVMPKELAH